MSELNETVRKLRDMDWEKMYEDENSGLDAVSPSFEEMVKRYDYRYEWVINKIREYIEPKGLKILVIGSGTGVLEHFLLEKGYRDITSVEVEDKTIERMKSKVVNVKFIKGFVESLPFEDNSFHVVITNQLLEHLIEPEVAVKEMYRVLTTKGLMLNTVPKDGMIYSKMHRHDFDLYSIIKLFKTVGENFTVVEIHKNAKSLRYDKPNVFAIRLVK